METGWEGDRRESDQITEYPDLKTILHGVMCSGGDGLTSSDRQWTVLALANYFLEIDETVFVLFLSYFISYPLCQVSFWVGSVSYCFHLSAGMKGSGWGSLPPSPARQEAEGNLVLSYSGESEYSMNKTNKQTVPLRCYLGHVLKPTELLLISIPADQMGNFVSF